MDSLDREIANLLMDMGGFEEIGMEVEDLFKGSDGRYYNNGSELIAIQRVPLYRKDK